MRPRPRLGGGLARLRAWCGDRLVPHRVTPRTAIPRCRDGEWTNSRVVRIPTAVLDPTQQQLDLGEREHILRCIGIAEVYDRVRSWGQRGGQLGDGSSEAVREVLEMKSAGQRSGRRGRTRAQLEQSGVLVVGFISVSHAGHDSREFLAR